MKSDELKVAMKESPRRYTNPFLSDEENEKIDFWNKQELEHSIIKDDFTNNREDEKHIPSEFLEKETEFYTDKNVMECELPELLVCYKESGFHVKDICVDEGTPHGEKIMFHEDKHYDMIEGSLKPQLLRFSPREDGCTNSDLCSGTIGKEDTHLPNLEVTDDHRDIGDDHDEMIERNLDRQLRSSSMEGCCTKCDTSSGTEEVDTNSTIPGPTTDHGNTGNISIDTEMPVQDGLNSIPGKERGTKEKVVIEMVISNELKNMSHDDDDAPYELNHNVEQISSSADLLDNTSSDSMPVLEQDYPLPSLKFLLDSIKNGAHDVDQQPREGVAEEISERPLVGYKAEELGRTHQEAEVSKESPIKGNDGQPATSNGLETQSASEVGSDNIKMANLVQRGEGESSFSVSGLITYSGPIPFSGSVSLRSDSSTTSTRSFAFPILQTEWNSSPVRMAKADRRQLKHRGWRHGLLCCRF